MPATAKQPSPPSLPLATLSHRFGPPDFDSVGMWLLGELKERWPHVNERNIFGWLRSLTDASEYLFIRNEKAVLLAQQIRENFELHPTVIEIFCLGQDGGLQDAAGLYTEMKRWAQSLGTEKMIVEEFTNVPRPMIVEAVGQPLETEKIAVVWLKNTLPT
jgi:hypothetical protein